MAEATRSKWINDKFFAETPDGTTLAGSKCTLCGKIHFPQTTVCDQCFSRNQMEIIPLSKEGKLFTYTIVEKTTRSKVPYAFGFVELPKEKLRFFSVLTQCEPFDQLKTGMPVEVVFEPVLVERDGTERFGYKFRPKK